jgi:uncharacterized protein YfbU (UPF0304 family)
MHFMIGLTEWDYRNTWEKYMRLSNGERLGLYMLADISEKLGLKGETDPRFIKEALLGGQLWAIPQVINGIEFEKEQDEPKEVEEVRRILEMWHDIEVSFSRLSKDQQIDIEERFGKSACFFPGFDGNYEATRLATARFMIEWMDRCQHFANRTLGNGVVRNDWILGMWDKYKNASGTSHEIGYDLLVEILSLKRPL